MTRSFWLAPLLAGTLIGCALEAPLAPSAQTPSTVPPPATGFGQAILAVHWPTQGRAIQGLPRGAARIDLAVLDASSSLLATGSITRAAGETVSTASLEIPTGSGRTITARVDAPGIEGIASGQSPAFTVLRNQVVEVSLPLASAIRTFAGDGRKQYSGDQGPAAAASFFNLRALSMGPDDTLYVADYQNHAVRAVAPDRTVRTVVGKVDGTKGVKSTPETSGEGGPAGDATCTWPIGIHAAPNGDLYIADIQTESKPRAERIRLVPAAAGTRYGQAMAAGHIYTIYRVETAGAINSTAAGAGMVLDQDGALVFTEQANNRLMQLAPDGTASILVNTADVSPSLQGPWGVLRDGQGNLLFGEYLGNRVRALCRTPGSYYGVAMAEAGKVYTVMDGTGDVPKPAGKAPNPRQLALDSMENLYFVDNANHAAYRVDRTTGQVSIVVGGQVTPSGTSVATEEGTPSLQATLGYPHGLAIDGNRRMLIGDSLNARIRSVYF